MPNQAKQERLYLQERVEIASVAKLIEAAREVAPCGGSDFAGWTLCQRKEDYKIPELTILSRLQELPQTLAISYVRNDAQGLPHLVHLGDGLFQLTDRDQQ